MSVCPNCGYVLGPVPPPLKTRWWGHAPWHARSRRRMMMTQFVQGAQAHHRGECAPVMRSRRGNG